MIKMIKKYKEANITINNIILTTSQSMTIRVALEMFCKDLIDNGLGEDIHGQEIKKLYLERIHEIRKVLYRS